MKNQEILNSLNEKLKAAEESVRYLRQTKSSFESLIKEEPSDLWIEKNCPETKLEIKKMDSVEGIEAEIKMLQSKLELYKELEKTKSPAEEAYKRVYGIYPPVGDIYWENFKEGYDSVQKDYKVGEYQETEEETDEIEEGATLYELLGEFLQYDNHRKSICRLVNDWLYDNSTTVTEDYSTVTLKFKKGAFGNVQY